MTALRALSNRAPLYFLRLTSAHRRLVCKHHRIDLKSVKRRCCAPRGPPFRPDDALPISTSEPRFQRLSAAPRRCRISVALHFSDHKMLCLSLICTTSCGRSSAALVRADRGRSTYQCWAGSHPVQRPPRFGETTAAWAKDDLTVGRRRKIRALQTGMPKSAAG